MVVKLSSFFLCGFVAPAFLDFWIFVDTLGVCPLAKSYACDARVRLLSFAGWRESSRVMRILFLTFLTWIPTLLASGWRARLDVDVWIVSPPPPLYKLRPCPSYSRRRDCINLGPNFNSVPNVVQPHKTWVW